MKKLFLVSFFVISLFGFDWAGKVYWSMNYEVAKKLSQRTNKPIFVDIALSHCPPCKYLATHMYVDDKIASKRLQQVIDLHKQHQVENMRRYEGKIVKVLFEDLKPNSEVFGYTDNYCQVFVKGGEELLGKIVDVKITEAYRTSLKGKVIAVAIAE